MTPRIANTPIADRGAAAKPKYLLGSGYALVVASTAPHSQGPRCTLTPCRSGGGPC
jgi:hypothetical protein